MVKRILSISLILVAICSCLFVRCHANQYESWSKGSVWASGILKEYDSGVHDDWLSSLYQEYEQTKNSKPAEPPQIANSAEIEERQKEFVDELSQLESDFHQQLVEVCGEEQSFISEVVYEIISFTKWINDNEVDISWREIISDAPDGTFGAALRGLSAERFHVLRKACRCQDGARLPKEECAKKALILHLDFTKRAVALCEENGADDVAKSLLNEQSHYWAHAVRKHNYQYLFDLAQGRREPASSLEEAVAKMTKEYQAARDEMGQEYQK